MKIQRLLPCEWGQPCNPVKQSLLPDPIVELNYFFFDIRYQKYGFCHRFGQRSPNSTAVHFPRWSTLYQETHPEIFKREGRICLKDKYLRAFFWDSGDQTLFVYNQSPEDRFKSLLVEETEGKLTGIYRMFPDGLELEYRGLYSTPELDPSEYRSTRTLRQSRSAHYEDITRVEHRYPADEQLLRKYGVRWGASHSEVAPSALVRGYRLQVPLRFFGEESWHLPIWKESFDSAESNSTTTRGSWSHREQRFYLYQRDGGASLRLLKFTDTAPEALQEIHEYSRSGEVVITRPAVERTLSARVLNTPFNYSGEHSGTERLLLGEAPQRFTTRLSDRYDPDCSSRWRPFVLDDPLDFFRRRGHAFVKWIQILESLRRTHQYSFATDRSWVDTEGHTYFLRREGCWEDRFPLSHQPEWHILEYAENQLIRVHAYDREWREIIYEPRVLPPLEEALGMSQAQARRRATEDAEVCIELRRQLSRVYERPLPANILPFDQDLARITFLHEIQDAAGQGLEPLEGRDIWIAVLLKNPRVLLPFGGVVVCLLFLLFLRFRRNWRLRHLYGETRRSRDMGFK